jgi:sec-independent protein translocase protein TatA
MSGFYSPWHIAIFLLVVLLLFGTKRLPEMGKALGKGMREFKSSISGEDEGDRRRPVELTATAEEQHTPAAPRERDTVG